MSWSVINETGVEPATLTVVGNNDLLHSPTFTVRADDDSIATLHYKVGALITSVDGVIFDVLYLDTFIKCLPRLGTGTCNGTFLGVSDNRAFDIDFDEIDLQ